MSDLINKFNELEPKIRKINEKKGNLQRSRLIIDGNGLNSINLIEHRPDEYSDKLRATIRTVFKNHHGSEDSIWCDISNEDYFTIKNIIRKAFDREIAKAVEEQENLIKSINEIDEEEDNA
jgi:hypothetical protein